MLVTAVPILRYYDVTRPVTIQSDSTTEQNYAQIEKECLCIVFVCQRFHYYLYRRGDVTAETDHRPLVFIFTKPLLSAPKHLQRMLLRALSHCLRQSTDLNA